MIENAARLIKCAGLQSGPNEEWPTYPAHNELQVHGTPFWAGYWQSGSWQKA